MTYRSKRAREILAATAKSNATEVVSQPTKKQATKSPQNEVLKDDKWGPFSPPITTTTSDQQPPNSLGSIWKNPLGSTSSSVKEAATSGYQNKYPAKVPPNIPHSIAPDSLNSPSTSHKPPERPKPATRGIRNRETGAVKTSATAPQDNHERQKNGNESEEIPKQSKSLRPKALPDWPVDIDFDDKEEVLTIDWKRQCKCNKRIGRDT